MALNVDDENRTLFIGNLDRNVSEEILYELFLQAGPIEKVVIHNGKNSSNHYGFVTYKHECSIDYAIELYVGTSLYKKELSIKKRIARSNNSGQQINDSQRHVTINPGQSKLNFISQGLSEQLNNYQKFISQNLNLNAQSMSSIINIPKGNRCDWKKPYDRGSRSHSSKPWDTRNKRKDRDYGSKVYQSRKNRHRD